MVRARGWKIVTSVLSQAKLSCRKFMSRLRARMRGKIISTVKTFSQGGDKNKSIALCEVIMKYPKEGGLGLRDPASEISTRKIIALKTIITKDRKPWARHTERRRTRTEK